MRGAGISPCLDAGGSARDGAAERVSQAVYPCVRESATCALLRPIGALRRIAGQQLKVILLLDSLWCVPGELRREPHVRLARKPVEADELLSALSALRVH